MKRIIFTSCFLFVCAFAFVSCGSASPVDKGTCNAGVCVRGVLNGALRLNENVPFVVTITSDTPQAGVKVIVATDNANAQITDSTGWTLDIEPGAPQILMTSVKLIAEGAYDISTRVTLNDGKSVEYKLRVGIAQGGATLEPAATGY